MMQQVEEEKFLDIAQYGEALSAFKEPTQTLKNLKNFTIHPDPLIEEYFKYVAFKGQTGLEWEQIRNAFLWKLKTVINDMRVNSESNPCTKENEDMDKLNRMATFILARAEAFEGAPFTIQRVCELLVWPSKHYNNSLGKFLRALEKTINVITCVMPNGVRITNADEAVFQPADEESNNGVENNFIVRVDELEMNKPLPQPNSSGKTIGRQNSIQIGPDVHFAAPGIVSSKINGDSSNVVTYPLPIGPELPIQLVRAENSSRASTEEVQ